MLKKLNKILKILFALLVALAIVAGVAIISIMIFVRSQYAHKIYDEVDALPSGSVMVVLGASVKSDKTPSDALADRLEIGVRAWRADKAEKIILSGDDGRYAMPEIETMYKYVSDAGVPDEMIIIDGNNARTFDSCYRLRNELDQNDVVLVTQGFHLPRALYLCNEVGLDASGIDSDLRSYHKIAWFTLRDWLASFLAFIDIKFERLPTYLEQ